MISSNILVAVNPVKSTIGYKSSQANNKILNKLDSHLDSNLDSNLRTMNFMVDPPPSGKQKQNVPDVVWFLDCAL